MKRTRHKSMAKRLLAIMMIVMLLPSKAFFASAQATEEEKETALETVLPESVMTDAASEGSAGDGETVREEETASQPGQGTGEAPGITDAESESGSEVPGMTDAESGSGGEAPGITDTESGSDANVSGNDAELPGNDAEAPGSDAGLPGNDAGGGGSDSHALSEDAAQSAGGTDVSGNDAKPDDGTLMPEPPAESGGMGQPGTERSFSCTLEGDVTVAATVPWESGLPEDAELCVERLAEGTEEYKNVVRSAILNANLPKQRALYFIPYDIYFLSGGRRIEPENGAVSVSMRFEKDPFAKIATGYGIHDTSMEGPSFEGQILSGEETERFAVHILADGTVDKLKGTSSEWVSDRELQFQVGSFSVMGPAMIAEGNQTSGNLADFLEGIGIYDEEGNLVNAKDLEDGGEYKIKLHFKEPEDMSKLFRPATKEEMMEAGIPETDIPEEGEWMYVPLGDDISAENLGDLGSEDVRVSSDGKFLLVRYQKNANSVPMDEVYVEFTGTLDGSGDDGTFDIVTDAMEGTYTPPGADQPYMNKQALKYDPETHSIKYTVRVTNPTDKTLNGFDFEDVYSVGASADVRPKLREGSLKVGGKPYLDESVTEEQGDAPNEGKFRFHCDEKLEPGKYVDIEYELDVSDLVEKLGKTVSEFLVNNEASAMPPQEFGTEPFQDDEKYEVDLGTLTKNGWINTPEKDPSSEEGGDFWGYYCVIKWVIEVYDPYKPLDGLKLSDVLTKDGNPIDPNIIGIVFEFQGEDGTAKRFTFVKDMKSGENKEDLQKLLDSGFLNVDEEGNVTFDFTKIPDGFKDKFFTDSSHQHLKMHVYTQYEEGEPGHGTYNNTVTGKLPSEIADREDDAYVNVGEPGVESRKEGELLENGMLHYKVTTNVSANIKELEEGNWNAYGIGAGLLEHLHVTDGTYTPKEGESKGELDIFEAIEVKSVTATYEDDQKREQTVEFVKLGDGEKIEAEKVRQEHKYGVYCVSWRGTVQNGEVDLRDPSNFSPYHIAIVLNPQIEKSKKFNENERDRIFGTWPDDLAGRDVTLTVEYDIDPKKAYFITTTNNKKADYQGCETLYEYLSMKGSILVYNYVDTGVRSSRSFGEATVPMTVPLTKKGEAHVDLEKNEKYINYEVTFQNGGNNNAAIPKETQNLVFHDRFDERMEYVEKSLTATLYVYDQGSQGQETDQGGQKQGADPADQGQGADQEDQGQEVPSKTEFPYTGSGPCAEGENNKISANWSDFKDSSGMTLQKAFNSQIGHYNIVFAYKVKPGENMPMDEQYVDVKNDAWVSYDGHETAHVTSSVDFPTGALTKQSQLEGGKVSFYVEVNAEASDMSPGSETLEIVDKATNHQYLELDEDSVKVQEFWNGGWKDLQEAAGDASADDSHFTKTIGEDGKLTLKVPDKKHLRIWYTYSLTEEGKNQENVTISNTVEIIGQKPMSHENVSSFSVRLIQDSANFDNDSFTIWKVRKGSSTGIGNVKFILYATNTGISETSEAAAEAARIGKPTLEKDGSTLSPAKVFTTDAEGKITVEWEYLRDGDSLLYALVESDVPEGFVRLEDPIYFRLSKEAIEIVEPKPGGDLVTVGKEISGGKLMTVGNEFHQAVLPNTGGPGVWKEILPCLAVSAAGMGMILSTRRRRGKNRFKP